MEMMAVIAMGAGTLLNAAGTLRQGEEAKQVADYNAAQMNIQAGKDRAMSQREAEESRRQGRIAQSNLAARAAASGGWGGIADPGAVRRSMDIAERDELNALSILYNGESSAVNLENQAELTRHQGREARKASQIAAISSVLTQGGKGMYSKYGGGGSPTDSGGPVSTYKDGTSIYWDSPRQTGRRYG